MPNRSFHFIATHKPEHFSHIASLEADHFIFDLEDAVPGSLKEQALANVSDFLNKGDQGNIFIRINEIGSEHYRKDVELVRERDRVGVVIPKVDTREQLKKVFSDVGGQNRRVIVLIESFLGLENISTIARGGGLFAIGLGLEDMFSGLTVENSRLATLAEQIRAKTVLTCKAYGILAIDTISNELRDADKLAEECNAVRNLGFNGKFTIHPGQIPVVNARFDIDDAVFQWAENVAGSTNLDTVVGYTRIDGEVITPPKVKKARMILKEKRGMSNE